CSRAQNARNTVRRNRRSPFKGVERHGRRWRARIVVDGRMIEVGSYPTPEEAALAYDDAARLYHGEFARTNEMIGLLNRQIAPVARVGACADSASANPSLSGLPRVSRRTHDSAIDAMVRRAATPDLQIEPAQDATALRENLLVSGDRVADDAAAKHARLPLGG